MRIAVKATLLFPVLFFSFLFSFTNLQRFEGVEIETIEVKNNFNISKRQILALMDITEGDAFELQAIQSSFVNLYDTGYFNDLQILADWSDEEKVILIVEVVELYKVNTIDFKGGRKYTKDVLTEDIPFKIGDYYSESELNYSVNTILDKYRDDGYPMAKVYTEVVEDKENRNIAVTFIIEEGSEMLVAEINIIGNDKYSDRQVQKELETKVDKFFSSGVYDEEKFELDKQRLLYFYKKNGYINARLLRTEVDFRWKDASKKKSMNVYITMEIDEGLQYYFGDLEISGNEVFSEEELRKNLQRRPGEVFDQEIHDRDMQQLNMMYREKGYIFSRVIPQESISITTREVFYKVNIQEGEIGRIERIIVTGNEKTKDYVITRELDIHEGEIYNQAKVQRSMEKLYNTQFFKDVRPEPRPGSVEGLMNVYINVEEQQTGLFTFGAGYSSQSRFNLQGSVEQKNLFGKGQKVKASAQLALRDQVVSLSFTEPWFLGKEIILNGEVGFSRRYQAYTPDFSRETISSNGDPTNGYTITTNFDRILYDGEGTADENQVNSLVNTSSASVLDYVDHNFNISALVGYRFATWYTASVRNSYTFSREFLNDAKEYEDDTLSQRDVYENNKELFDTNRELFKEEPDWTSVYNLTMTLRRDSRNIQINPTRGNYFEFVFDLSTIDYDLTRYKMTYAKFHTFFWKLVGMYQIELSTLGNGLGGRFNYDTQRFYDFDQEDVRGWQYDDIFNFRSGLGSDYLVNGSFPFGQALVKHNMELRIPIQERLVWAAAYLDAGNLNVNKINSKENTRFLYNYKEYMYSTGLGLAVQLPVFPMRFYFGYRFIYDQESGGLKYFNHDDKNFLGIEDWRKPETVFTVARLF